MVGLRGEAFHGRGVLLVQSLEQAGQVRVKASARGLETASFDLFSGEAFDCQPVKNQRLFEIRVDKQAGLPEEGIPQLLDFIHKLWITLEQGGE